MMLHYHTGEPREARPDGTCALATTVNEEISYDRKLDTSGLNCPLPILKTKRELATMSVGERLYVIATDPGSLPDFKVFSRQMGHTLSLCEARDGAFHFILRKNRPPE